MNRTALATGFLLLMLAAANAGAQGFEGIFDDETTGEESRHVTVAGEVGVQLQYYPDAGWESEVVARPYAEIELSAAGERAEAILELSVETSDAAGGALIGSVIDELYLTTYFDAGHLTAGRTRIEWGTGDGLHAIDPLNATDQSNGPTTDYLGSRIPETLIALSLYLGPQAVAELVYRPFFHPVVSAAAGRWAVVDASSIPGYSSIEPVDTGTLEYSQGAARVSGSVGPADLGALYYYGYMPEAGYDYTTTFTGTDPLDPNDYTTTTEIVYTRAQLIGIEAAAAAGPFTLHGEAGYWLSEDRDGSAPEMYNSRLVYLGGLDVRVPRTSLFASAQVQGSYTFSASDLSADDVDRFRLFDDLSTTHLVLGALEALFARDTVKVRVAGLYAVEARGLLIMPSCSWTIGDEAELRVEGEVIGGASQETGTSPYYAWRGNDNITVSLGYRF